jgi:hypothetical protein
MQSVHFRKSNLSERLYEAFSKMSRRQVWALGRFAEYVIRHARIWSHNPIEDVIEGNLGIGVAMLT